MKTPVDLAQLVEVMGDAVIVADRAGKITLWNAAATRIFGFSEAEALVGNGASTNYRVQFRSFW